MATTNRIPQIYGYLVCLAAVITFLVASGQIINALLDRMDPLHAREAGYQAAQLYSFEGYSLQKRQMAYTDSLRRAVLPDEATLRNMYEAERADLIAVVRHRTSRDAIVNGVLLLLSVLLFFFHWRWLHRLTVDA